MFPPKVNYKTFWGDTSVWKENLLAESLYKPETVFRFFPLPLPAGRGAFSPFYQPDPYCHFFTFKKTHAQETEISCLCNWNSIGIHFEIHKHKIGNGSASIFQSLLYGCISDKYQYSLLRGAKDLLRVVFFRKVCSLMTSFLTNFNPPFITCVAKRKPYRYSIILASDRNLDNSHTLA